MVQRNATYPPNDLFAETTSGAADEDMGRMPRIVGCNMCRQA